MLNLKYVAFMLFWAYITFMAYPIQTASQLSSHIRALRRAKGLNQAQLGARLGLSQARMARIEGDPLSISVEQLLQVLSALGVQVTLEPLSEIRGSANVALPPVTGGGTGKLSAPPESATAAKDQDW